MLQESLPQQAIECDRYSIYWHISGLGRYHSPITSIDACNNTPNSPTVANTDGDLGHI